MAIEANKLEILNSALRMAGSYHINSDDEESTTYEVVSRAYSQAITELFGDNNSWNRALSTKKIQFESTSFIRGLTLDYSVILVDEMQNLSFHELDSVITRVGKGSRIIFAGDYLQSDFTRSDDRNGIMKFLTIVEQLKKFEIVNFGWEDIVRSDFVRDYIMTKEMLGIE